MKRQHIMAGSAIALVLVFVVAVFGYSWLQERRLVELAAKPDSVFVRPHSPTYGSADAKVRIVEFLDPACETCRAFYPLVKDIIDLNGGRVQLVVRYTPFHAGADTAVAVMEAARLQGMDQRHHDAGTAGADRVAERTGAAVDVDLVAGHAHLAHEGHGHHGEGFVDLPEIDIGH